jgi:ceramide glucosyltransferase
VTIHFCVASRDDPATAVIQTVLKQYPGFDARLFVEDEDCALHTANSPNVLGPNPKIRNMSRAYREGKGDLVWIVDCNVWVSSGACARMVDKICGYGKHGSFTKAYKLVHHLPICVDVHNDYTQGTKARKLLRSMSQGHDAPQTISSSLTSNSHGSGGRLEELFLSSSHAKMYVAISTVAVAPCIVGKSNMFRRSHLYGLTGGMGIDYFSHNICEDHLIGDLLWKSTIDHCQPCGTGPETEIVWRGLGNHGLVKGDLAIQPVAGMSVTGYIARRVRWLRVRKFTVPAATAVEPGTESVVCSLMGAWGVTMSPLTKDIAGSSWLWMLTWWLSSMLIWSCVDRTVYLLLHSGATVEADDSVPAFAKPLAEPLRGRRSWTTWLSAWVGRELLAFTIWFWAIWGGVSVTWRERRFWVGFDMRVHEIPHHERQTSSVNGNGHPAKHKVM